MITDRRPGVTAATLPRHCDHRPWPRPGDGVWRGAGRTTNLDLWRWWTAARDGDPSVDRNVVVRLLDATGAAVLAWQFRNAFPVVHRITPLDAASSDTVLETVELAFDTMDAEA